MESGVVTKIVFAAGSAPRTLQPLLRVSGAPLYAFVSSSPLYKDLSTSLSSGSQVANVKALQRALRRSGHYSGAIDGDFDSATEAALEDWQEAKGLSVTGTIDITRFVWVPKGGVISAWKVAVGDRVGTSAQLAKVTFDRPLRAQTLVDQSDVTSLKVGQRAELAIDGYDSASCVGTITSISTKPASSSSGGGSSGSASYTVTLRVKKLPAFARQGMTGTLSIMLARKTDVLLVPTGAVVGSGASALVRILQNGAPVSRSVTTGMATSSLTEITGGLLEGEKVVTAEITGTTESTASGSGLGGSGFRRSGGGYGAPPSGGSFGGGGTFGGGQ